MAMTPAETHALRLIIDAIYDDMSNSAAYVKNEHRKRILDKLIRASKPKYDPGDSSTEIIQGELHSIDVRNTLTALLGSS